MRRLRCQDLLGRVFGNLSVLRFAGRRPDSRGVSRAFWLCRCSLCGREKEFEGRRLTGGRATGCGCQRGEHLRTHGDCNNGRESSEYVSWRAMHDRCRRHPKYSGRGIEVCAAWFSFEQFVEDMGRKLSPDLTIERKDGNANYSCGKCAECLIKGWISNCYWATRKVQSRHRDVSRIIEYSGKSLSLAEWAEAFGIHPGTLNVRITKLGWSIDRALTQPVEKQVREKRQLSRIIQFNGQTKTCAEWARALGLDYATLSYRLRKGWSAERAFTEPVHPTFKRVDR